MNRTRLESERLATLSLGAGVKLAVADVLAALVALPDRAGEPRGVGQPSAPRSHGNGDPPLTMLRSTRPAGEHISRRFRRLPRHNHPGVK